MITEISSSIELGSNSKGTVIRQKCTSSLPLPLCLATFLVSSQWCLYGTLVSDVYIITPNGIGMILAITQLSLFLVFPSTPGGQSVMKLLCSCCCGAKDDDVEARRQSLGKRTRFFCRRRPSADKSPLPKKISPQPCSSVHHNTSAQMPCENGAFSRSASLGSLGSLDESEFASSQRGILPNPSPHRHYHPYIVEPVQLSSVTAEVEPFGRLRDVDEHERQWSQQQQLSRTNSAPELNQ
uniref:Sugar transporter SWEET n=1 Tax=Steinernema glaseri TaxID=37863 RepID=A0A1I8AI69_9BILA